MAAIDLGEDGVEAGVVGAQVGVGQDAGIAEGGDAGGVEPILRADRPIFLERGRRVLARPQPARHRAGIGFLDAGMERRVRDRGGAQDRVGKFVYQDA